MQKKLLFISILAATAILSMQFLFKNSVSQTTDFPGGAKAEKNFFKYKEEREEMIKMMTEGKIKKEDPYDSGFAFYYTPPQFKDVNKDDHINQECLENETMSSSNRSIPSYLVQV